jgi:hypothetical protein
VVDDLTARAWGGGNLGFRPLARAPSFEMFAVHNHGVPQSALARAFVDGIERVARAARSDRVDLRQAITTPAPGARASRARRPVAHR